MARESGRPDHLERAAAPTGPLNQHGGAAVLAPRRARSGSRSSTRRKACGSSPRRSRPTSSRSSPSRTTTSLDTIPGWQEALPRHGRGEDGQARRPRAARRRMKEIHEERGGLFGAGYVLDRDQGQLDLERRPERAEAEGDATRASPSARSRPERASTRSTPCSTSRWPASSRWVSRPR